MQVFVLCLNNKYGIDVAGDFNIFSNSSEDKLNSISGYGSVVTKRLPNLKETKFKKVGTDEIGFLGFENNYIDVLQDRVRIIAVEVESDGKDKL